MSISLEGRLWWRQTAAFHVQLELEKDSGRLPELSEVKVQGRVVRVFRSDGRLAPGDHVAFKIWVCRPGLEPTGPAYIYHDDFIQATHMEVFLHGSPEKLDLAGYEFTILDNPSEEPSMSVAQLEELLVPRKTELRSERKTWWQFWKM